MSLRAILILITLLANLATSLPPSILAGLPVGFHIPDGIARLVGDVSPVDTSNNSFSRFIVYLEQRHPHTPPDRIYTTYITHVITAFASSDHFISDSSGPYEPFMSVDEVRSRFFPRVNVCMSIGGPGDTDGFYEGVATNSSRQLFARNVAATVERLGYDCVDISWQYPSHEHNDTIPLLLAEIKNEIGDRELSIAVPGRERDMMAYTPDSVKEIDKIVDYMNVMAYDLIDHRDSLTRHHSSFVGARNSIASYVSRGMTPKKVNLGVAFHAKWFVTAPGQTCQHQVGVGFFSMRFAVCRLARQIHQDGSETGMSGTMTFEESTFAPIPHLTQSPDGTCGVGTSFKCPGNNTCCSEYGVCGRQASQCGVGCQAEFGYCNGRTARESFKKALANKHYDWHSGGKWFWDSDGGIFWTWDTAFNMRRKLKRIVIPEGLGGIFVSSIGQDSHDWHRLKRLQDRARKYF